jgi:Na+-transporting NADH:ubiquinone oxidoreductase subunit C
VALEDDYNTIFGVIFDHDGETPGLGAEINTSEFENQFKGKQLFDDDGEFVSIRVLKPSAPPIPDHSVMVLQAALLQVRELRQCCARYLAATGNISEIKKN